MSDPFPSAGTEPAQRPGRKGRQTRAAIVDAALALAQQAGLEGLSIGALAEATGMSKSGVFAHFGSREELQIAVLGEYFVRFERDVFAPILQLPRGLPRLKRLFDLWMDQVALELDAGCIFISGAVEFDDRPGPVRDALAQTVETWLAAMRRTVEQSREAGHLRPEADARQVTFEIHGLILALHFEARLLRWRGAADRARAGFANVLQRYRAEGAGSEIPA